MVSGDQLTAVFGALADPTRRATARLSHLEAQPLRDATEWLARYQQYWDESYDRLDALLAALQGENESE